MIRVLVLYPRIDGKNFDFDYYRNQHIPLVMKRLAPIKVEVDLGIVSQGKPSPYIAVSHMIFESREQLSDRYMIASKELNDDKVKFTNIDIITQISEIVDL